MSDDFARGDFWPFQHHDPTYRPHERLRLRGARVHPREGDDFTPAHQTYGDVQGGLLWEEAAGKREHLHSWFFTGPGVVSVSGGAGDGTPKEQPPQLIGDNGELIAVPVNTTTQARDVGTPGGDWLPIRFGDGTPDERYRAKSPTLPTLGGKSPKLPKGHTGIVTAGTEEYSQQETLHPDWLNYILAVNKAGDPGCGTLVHDLEADGSLGPSAPLQRVFSVLDDSIAWQLGRGGRIDGGATNGYGLVVDWDRNEGAYMSAFKGGPLMTGSPFCVHGSVAKLGGVEIKPGHIFTGANFCGAQGDGPLNFEPGPYPANARELPQPVHAHIRYDGGMFKVHSSCSFFVPPPPDPPPPPEVWDKWPDGKWRKRGDPPPSPPEPPPPHLPPPSDPEDIGFKPGGELGPGGTRGPITPPPFGPGGPGTVPLGPGTQFVTDKFQQHLKIIGDGSKPVTPHSTNCIAVPNIYFKGTATTVGQPNLAGSASVTDEQRNLFVNAPTVAHLQGWGKGDGTWEGFQPYTANSTESFSKGAGGLMILPPDVEAHQAVNGTGTTQHRATFTAVSGLSSIGWGSPDLTTGGLKNAFVSTYSSGNLIFQAKGSTGSDLGFLGMTNDGDMLGFNSSGGVNFSLTNGLATLPAITTPSTPSTGYGGYYTKASSPTKPYFISDDGTEYDLTSGGGSVSAPLTLTLDDANNSSAVTIATLRHTTSGSPTAGMGAALDFSLEDSAGNNDTAGRIINRWASPTSTDEAAEWGITVLRSGASVELLELNPSGSTLSMFSGSTDEVGRLVLAVHCDTNAAADFGAGIDFQGDDDAGNISPYGTIDFVATDTSAGAIDTDLVVGLVSGGTDTERARVTSEGAIVLGEISTPSTPASGKGALYFKSGSRAHSKGDDGVERRLGDYRVLHVDTTPAATMTYTLPANTLGANNETLQIEAAGNHDDLEQVSLTFGGTTLISQNLNAGDWVIRGTLVRTGSSAQLFYGTIQAGAAQISAVSVASAIDLTANANLVVGIALSADAGDEAEFLHVAWRAAP